MQAVGEKGLQRTWREAIIQKEQLLLGQHYGWKFVVGFDQCLGVQLAGLGLGLDERVGEGQGGVSDDFQFLAWVWGVGNVTTESRTQGRTDLERKISYITDI